MVIEIFFFFKLYLIVIFVLLEFMYDYIILKIFYEIYVWGYSLHHTEEWSILKISGFLFIDLQSPFSLEFKTYIFCIIVIYIL